MKNKKGTPDYHREKIAIDTVKHPFKGQFLGGPTINEATAYLKSIGYTNKEIERLQK